MTSWSELNPREKPGDLPDAIQRRMAPGVDRYGFVQQGHMVDDPAIDATGRYFVSPREYGFSIRGFKDGKTAWARDFANGTMLVVNAEGVSHVLSPKVRARVLFVSNDGTVVQDTGTAQRVARRVPDLTTIRLTVNATFDLHGEKPEVARTILMRLVDRALLSGPRPGESEATIVDHLFESSSVVVGDRRLSNNSDFSKLLDI